MNEKTKKIVGFILSGLILVAFVMVVVGMFVGQVTTSMSAFGQKVTESAKLFDADWGKGGAPSNTFAIISFIVTIVGLGVLLSDSCLRIFAKKDIMVLRLAGIALAIVGAVLILVSALMITNDFYELLGGKDVVKAMGGKISAGAGVWLGFIFGLVGGLAGGASLLKPLK